MKWNDVPQGVKVSLKSGEVFFGNAKSSQRASPQLWKQCWRVHQVHGADIVAAKRTIIRADGHYTSISGQALAIQTADCMPVMVSIDNFKTVIALHIGWRGLQKKILTRALAPYKKRPKGIQIFVGPHIQYQSFYLNRANCEDLLRSHNSSLSQALESGWARPFFKKNDQFLVDLSTLLKNEAQAMRVQRIMISIIDTFNNPDYFSHRRHSQTSGRQLSYIKKF